MKRIVKFGIYSGIAMWIALFIGGAIFAKIFYGPEMAPKGKFNESQLNAFYFISLHSFGQISFLNKN